MATIILAIFMKTKFGNKVLLKKLVSPVIAQPRGVL